MLRFYLDSSAIVARYAREAGTLAVSSLYRSAHAGRSTLCASEWNIGEVLGVLQRKARLASRPRAYNRQKGQLHSELGMLARLRAFELSPVGSQLLREAWAVAERHQLYVADALQVVTAAQMACDHLVTGDGDLRRAAEGDGLDVIDPARDMARIKKLA